MANLLPMSFSDSDNCSSIYFPESTASPLQQELQESADIAALSRLSENLLSLLNSDLYADAYIRIPSASHGSKCVIPVHRAMLSVRSPFFGELFKRAKPGVKLDMADIIKGVEVGYESLMLVLGYVYTGRVGLLPREACYCADDVCDHVACRPTIDFLLEVLYASFTFQISELVNLFQRRLLDILDNVCEDDVLVILAVAKLCDASCEKLLSRCTEMVIRSELDIVTLEKSLPHDVFNKIMDSRIRRDLHKPDPNSFPDKHVRRIYRALDSDDVELVGMLLKEKPATTLDEACALHYAVTHCDSKITSELLELRMTDVNCRNPRGFTALHMAAMRKDPKIIVSLLSKKARLMEVTPDGRKAIQIAKQLTKRANYNKNTENGMHTPNDCLCIEILENAERMNPVVEEASVSFASVTDDFNFKSRLLDLEARVAMARLFFPTEAMVAMYNAKMEGTSEYTLHEDSSVLRDPQVSSLDDFNTTPFTINEKQIKRMQALSKTVETGRTYFPRCSKAIDKFMEDDINELATWAPSEEEGRSKKRYLELQEEIKKAFSEDKEHMSAEKRSAFSSSVSLSPPSAHRAKLARF